MRSYVTIAGDTWDMIAAEYFADGEKGVSRLITLNSAHAGIVRFPAGILLAIPDDEYEKNNDVPPWRR